MLTTRPARAKNAASEARNGEWSDKRKRQPKNRTMKTHMTKQHFQFIADVLRVAHVEAAAEMEQAFVEDMAERFANALRRTNPNFDHDRFLRAAIGDQHNFKAVAP
jgi:hypothetical protein